MLFFMFIFIVYFINFGLYYTLQLQYFYYWAKIVFFINKCKFFKVS
jgi:hypothetical protein